MILLVGASTVQGRSYPKHEPEKAFPEMKIYDAQGRPYREAIEDWDGARRRVTEDPEWSEWLSQQREQTDRWIAKHHDRVEWIAGWSNNFVSPKDGSKLTWTEEIPGEEVDHFSSDSDPRVEITDKLKAAWVRTWREHHADKMLQAARLYRLTGDDKYAEWAAGQMDFYTEHYLEWEPQRQGARLFWQCLTEGVNLITYAQTVRVLGDYPDPVRRQAWHDKFFVPEVEVLNENFPIILNITCWLRGAAAQVALIFDDEGMWDQAINGPSGIREQVAQGITSDYIWFEQSLGYNSYVVSALASLFETAGFYGRTEELALEMATVQNLMLSTTYMRFPNGALPTISDTKGQLYAPSRGVLSDLYRVFPTPIGLKDAAKERNWNTLLDPPSAQPADIPDLPEVTSRNFETSRMAVLRDGPWQVFFHYGQSPIKSHLQAEVLNYSAYYNDTDITHDPGTVGYGSDLHKNYYLRGLNHNVPLINGEGQEQPPKGRKPDPFAETRWGELREFSVKPARVSAAHPVYRSDASSQRSLAIEGDRLTDTVSVESHVGERQKLGLSLHLQGKVRLPESFAPESAFAEGRPESFGYWTDVTVADYTDTAAFLVDYGSVTMRVTFTLPGAFRVWHASTPDSPPERREGFYLETEGEAATFITTFEPAGGQ